MPPLVLDPSVRSVLNQGLRACQSKGIKPEVLPASLLPNPVPSLVDNRLSVPGYIWIYTHQATLPEYLRLPLVFFTSTRTLHMPENTKKLPATPRPLTSDEIKRVDGVAHVRVAAEVTFASVDEDTTQSTWSWTNRGTVPSGSQEVGLFWQIARYFINEEGFSRQEMAEHLEATASLLRGGE